MRKVFVITSFFLLVILILVLSVSIVPRKKKLNVILISLDCLSKNHMSLYGYSRNTTPNLDKFAKKAFVSDHYFSTGYLTPISEASVHTGFYPQGNRVINLSSKINTSTPTIAEILRSQKYRTAAYGATPEFYDNGIIGQGFRRGFEKYEIKQNVNDSLPSIENISEWIKSNKEPFFLWLPIGFLHFPYGDSPDYFVDKNYRGILRGNPLDYSTIGYIYENKLYSDASSKPNLFKDKKKAKSITLQKSDTQYIEDKYDDGIYYVDKYLGELFSFFEKSGILNNSIIIIQSEHGEDFGNHNYFMHYDIWDNNVNTSLIIYMPGMKSYHDKKHLISGVDILPTLVEILDIKPLKTDGISFKRLIDIKSLQNSRNEVFISRTPLLERISINGGYSNKEFIALDNTNHFQDYAIRNTTWKLIHRTARKAEEKYSWYTYISGEKITREEYELYDIQKDPFEKNNVYIQHKYEGGIKNLKLKLERFERESDSRIKKIDQSNTAEPYFN